MNFANYVQRRQLIQDGALLGLNLLPPDNDASIVPNVQEGAANTTPAELAQYLAEVAQEENPTATVPAAPTNLVATPGDGEATISFTAPSDGGSPIINYEYWITDASGGGFEAFSPPVTASPVTITGLPNGTTLHIRLRAINAVGPGEQSAIVEVTPIGPPESPYGLTATPGNAQVTITFSQGSNGGSPITNYQYSTDDGATFIAFSPEQDSSPVTISGLTNGTSYTIRLKAVSDIGESDASESVSATPNVTETIQTFTTVGSTTWTAPAGVTSVEYLVVGGGGGSGGGFDTGGGGGGGGGMVLTGSYSVTAGNTYTIIVGDGGAGGISIRNPVSETNGSSGQNSEFDSIVALGGGGGYASRQSPGGGSIGGPGASNPSVASEGGRGGGSAGDGNGAGGGGGGSAGNGDNGVANVGGNGGSGTSSSITGASATYGLGGRGSNGNSTYIAIPGTPNTGNGARGGGGASFVDENGAKGGSGIVILKYYV